MLKINGVFLYIFSFLLIYLNIKQLYKSVRLFKIFYYFILYDYILKYYYKNIIGSNQLLCMKIKFFLISIYLFFVLKIF